MNTKLIYSWYEQYKTRIYRYALAILKDPHLAEDVLQEAFLRLMSGKGFPEPGKEQAWLYRVARNLCYDILRKQHREIEAPYPGEYREGKYEYLSLISPLPAKEQEIVTLRIVGGLTHKEIAKVLGITEHAAKKRYERAIAALREQEENDGR